MGADDIKTMIEEDVRCDIHGDLYGHERVAEHLAERIDALVKENEELKQRLEALSSAIRSADLVIMGGWKIGKHD